MNSPETDVEDDWSGPADQERICALAAEVTAILRPRASCMSQPAIIFLAAEIVTTLLAELVPPDDVDVCIGHVIEGLWANIDAAVEVTDKPGRLQ